jgi:hypothetical protein
MAQMSLESLSIPSYMEASGGYGWRCHLWTFYLESVSSAKVMMIYDHALRQANVFGKPYIERFPKQARAMNGYGNLVKVPFGIHRKTGKRSAFLDSSLQPLGDISEALDQIEEVDPLVIDIAINQHGLTFTDSQSTLATPAKNFDYPKGALAQIIRNCWYWGELERLQKTDPSRVDYPAWYNYVLMLSRFGQAGEERILQFSRLHKGYDETRTLDTINYIRQKGYHAPSCKRLREGPGSLICIKRPEECGAI